jgi:GT2 family glycosyltransferase
MIGRVPKSSSELRYEKWMLNNEPNELALEQWKQSINMLDLQPKFSIVTPVYDPQLSHLKEAVESVKNQIYSNWELCIADDNSPNEEVKQYLREEAAKDPRIKVVFRESTGHIPACSNSALELSGGDYICFMDQDDLLSPDALFQMASTLNDEAYDLIYSDEDKVDQAGKAITPFFKPQWSPHSFLSRNYIGHFVCIKENLIREVNGFREGYEGSQDYDLLLRVTELTDKIHRIPRVLYHWRMHQHSTSMDGGVKSYAYENGKKALNDALKRRGIQGEVIADQAKPGHYVIDYQLDQKPLVSIIIPTKNNASVLSVCLDSIFQKSSYQDFEVIVLSNNSDEKKLFDLFDSWREKEKKRFRVLDQPFPFNYSKLMNNGVEESRGDYILLLNNDTEIIGSDWIECMLKHAQLADVGAVGSKMYYPDNTLQHGGVVIGLGAVAGHVFIRADKDYPGYYFNLKSVTNYSAVTAACLMVEKKKYLEVGGFDEELAIEYNDVDFCLRLLEAGYHNIYLPEVELYHYESLTRGHPHANLKTYKVHLKEVAYFQSKWNHYIEDDPFYNPNLSRKSTFFEIAVDI